MVGEKVAAEKALGVSKNDTAVRVVAGAERTVKSTKVGSCKGLTMTMVVLRSSVPGSSLNLPFSEHRRVQ